MARAQYTDMALKVDPTTAVVTALSDIRVHVYDRGTTNYASIYTAATGSVAQANPFLTALGKIEFWADTGAYDIYMEDATAPARIAPKTIGWEAVPAVAGGLPTSLLAADAGISLALLSAAVLRQVTQIGEVVEWWRPASSVPLPSGLEPADGRTIQAADHDFGTGGAIVLPDLRNAFILGADSAKADGTAAVAGEGAVNAPGIRGAGGTMLKNLSHAHSMQGHTHSMQGHTHRHVAPIALSAGNVRVVNPNSGHLDSWGSYNIVDTPAMDAVQIGPSNAGSASERWLVTSEGPSVSSTGAASDTNTGNGLSSTQDIRPAYVGLLRLIKVRRS